MTEARCMKCKANRELKDAKIVQTKNGRSMLKGGCGTCGTICCKFVKKQE